jgi:hypothetical protein
VELRHLQYFVAIAARRSFRRGAERVLGFKRSELEPRRPLRSPAAVA